MWLGIILIEKSVKYRTQQNSKINLPGSHRVGELLAQNAHDLADVTIIMYNPGCKEFTQRNDAQIRVSSSERHLSGCQAEPLHVGKVRGPNLRKLFQELAGGTAYIGFPKVEPIKGHKCLFLAATEDEIDPGDPVRLLAKDQMAHNATRTEGAISFVLYKPVLRKTVYKCAKGCWRT